MGMVSDEVLDTLDIWYMWDNSMARETVENVHKIGAVIFLYKQEFSNIYTECD